MQDVPMEAAVPASFPVTTLPGSPPSLEVLSKDLPLRFKRLPEASVFCETLLSLLNAAHDAVQAHDDRWKTVFCNAIKRFIKLLRRRPLLERLAGAETTAYTFREFNSKMDEIFAGVGLGVSPNRWMQDWKRGCGLQALKLNELVTGTSPRMLISEMKGERDATKAMLDMYTWLEGDMSGELGVLKSDTLERLRIYLRLDTQLITVDTVDRIENPPTSILSIFKWFIPERNVKITGDPIGSGSCGIVSRAEWRRRDGTIQDVVVKTLYEESAAKEQRFLKQLQFWYDLPTHPNIVQLYGGCHMSKKPFFVCEDAHGGSIVDFLGKEDNRGLFWSMFLQVAQGLKELHDHRIVHDGLKGNNILVGEGNTPKICDFDCSYIRTLSATFSQKTEDDQTNAVRWKPREKLEEAKNELPLYKSDIYSLGMTMIEALTQTPPFGMDLEEDIVASVMGGAAYKQPDEASYAEWQVISKLIAVNVEDRPNTEETIDLVRSLVPNTEQTALGG